MLTVIAYFVSVLGIISIVALVLMVFIVNKTTKEYKKTLKTAVNEIYKGHNKAAIKILKNELKDLKFVW